MDCTRCHREVPVDAAFCPACGASQPAAGGEVPWGARRLVRIPADARVAGVCAGIADYLDVDVTLVRALWIALSIVPGAVVGGLVAYVLAWFVMPEGRPARANTGRRLTRSVANAKIAGLCGGIAEYLGVDATLVRVGWIVLSVLPGAVLGGALAYVVGWIVVPKAPVMASQPQSHAA